LTDIIKYGMGRNYLPDWGFAEALREINQNFMDFGPFNQCVNEIPGRSHVREVTMVNEFSPGDHAFMKIGESGKRGVAEAVGKHGEGLKMASLVLKRNGCNVAIQYGSTRLCGVFYDDQYLGECFGFKVYPSDPIDGFQISFQIPADEFKAYERKKLDPDVDVLYTSYHGDILDRPKGEVYVGGHFVSVVEGLEYAYNFKPQFIELDRDRKVPRDFDVVYTASQILQGWDKMKLMDVVSKDAEYMSCVPQRIAKKFKPSMAGGKVVFRAGAIQAPQRVAEKLMEIPLNQKRVAKIKYTVSRKRTPHAIVKEFLGKHSRSFSVEGKVDAKILLEKSKKWK